VNGEDLMVKIESWSW